MLGKLDRPGTESSWLYRAYGCVCALRLLFGSAQLRLKRSERWGELGGAAAGSEGWVEEKDGETDDRGWRMEDGG